MAAGREDARYVPLGDDKASPGGVAIASSRNQQDMKLNRQVKCLIKYVINYVIKYVIKCHKIFD